MQTHPRGHSYRKNSCSLSCHVWRVQLIMASSSSLQVMTLQPAAAQAPRSVGLWATVTMSWYLPTKRGSAPTGPRSRDAHLGRSRSRVRLAPNRKQWRSPSPQSASTRRRTSCIHSQTSSTPCGSTSSVAIRSRGSMLRSAVGSPARSWSRPCRRLYEIESCPEPLSRWARRRRAKKSQVASPQRFAAKAPLVVSSRSSAATPGTLIATSQATASSSDMDGATPTYIPQLVQGFAEAAGSAEEASRLCPAPNFLVPSMARWPGLSSWPWPTSSSITRARPVR